MDFATGADSMAVIQKRSWSNSLQPLIFRRLSPAFWVSTSTCFLNVRPPHRGPYERDCRGAMLPESTALTTHSMSYLNVSGVLRIRLLYAFRVYDLRNSWLWTSPTREVLGLAEHRIIGLIHGQLRSSERTRDSYFSLLRTSVVTPKPAICGRFKTGHSNSDSWTVIEVLILSRLYFSCLPPLWGKNFAPGSRRSHDCQLGRPRASPGLSLFKRILPFQCCFTCRGLIRQVRSFKNEFLACKKIPVPTL